MTLSGDRLPPLFRRIRCTAVTQAGKACRSWSLPNTDPPRCQMHTARGAAARKGNEFARTHGFYARKNVQEEVERVMSDTETTPLDRFLVIVQVALLRLQDVFESGKELPNMELARLVEATASGGGSLTRALLAQQKLTPSAQDEWLKAMDEARDWINENLDWAVKL